jgi:uncharacterized protein YjiS (DUF1127 family)
MIAATRFAPGLNWIARTYSTIKTKLTNRRANNLAVRSLNALSDRELTDIGLQRSMIRSYVNGDKNV